MYKKIFAILLLVSIWLAGCTGATPTPDAGMIQTAIAQTQISEASNFATLLDTSTPEPLPPTEPPPTNTQEISPTETPLPTDEPTPAQSIEEIRENFLAVILEILENGEGLGNIESISVVRFGEPGILEIQIKTSFVSKDHQPDVSYEIIKFLATAIASDPTFKEAALTIVGGDDFVIHLSTFSAMGDYRYESMTNWDTMEKIHKKVMSYDEWVVAADAGFK